MDRQPSGSSWAVAGIIVVLFACAGGLYYKLHLSMASTKYRDRDVSGEEGNKRIIAATEKLLEREQREFIWQVEHEVLVVNGYWFKDLSKALAKADEKALLGFLAPHFSGHAMNKPTQLAMKTDFAEVVRFEDTGAALLPLTNYQFVTQLMEYRKVFAKEPKVTIKAKNLLPVVRKDYEGVWEGTALFRMHGEGGTRTAGRGPWPINVPNFPPGQGTR